MFLILQNGCRKRLNDFGTDNILGNVEPTATTVADVITKYARHTDGKIIEVTEDIAQTCAQLKEVREQISALESTKEDLEAKIKLGFGDAEAISYGGSTLATWKAAKDSTKIRCKNFSKGTLGFMRSLYATHRVHADLYSNRGYVCNI